jgi:2-polyprenyl-3-methyl-5-hydroxy-6-metoxy-1,4-benzoquinol methylase
LAPVPDNLYEYYPDEYYAIPLSVQRLDRIAHRQFHRIEFVRQFAPSGRLLDIGAGQGLFAHLAKQSGFEVQTIEMDERCCRYLREVVGVDAIQSDDPASILPQLEPQQVITLWHVVEHLPDPWGCLRRASDLLAPGGILLVAMPNPQALQFRIFGSHWVHLDAPRHLQLIPAQLLVRQVAEWGLQPVLITSNDRGAKGFSMNGWRTSLMNMSIHRPIRLAAAGVGTVIGRLARIAESRDLHGGEYTAIFRKVADEDDSVPLTSRNQGS